MGDGVTTVQRWTGHESRLLRHAMRLSIRAFAERLGIPTRTISKWEQRGVAINMRPDSQAMLDTLFAQAGEDARGRFATLRLEASGESYAANSAAGPPDLWSEFPGLAGFGEGRGSGVPLTVDDVAEAGTHIGDIVRLDNRYGSVDLVRLTMQMFRALRQKLEGCEQDSTILPDVFAVLGETAEVAGWLAYDANRHELVRTMNHESLHYSRLAGDRATELLTLQNYSMHAGSMGRPVEALQIARSVLESGDPLSPRVEALFLTRKARALAQAGDESAMSQFQKVRSLYLDGTTDADPSWAWWVDERELAWHEAMALRDLGQLDRALELFNRSVEATPDGETRSQFLHRAYLLQAQIEVGSWRDATASVPRLMQLSSEVGSPRTFSILRDSISRADAMNNVPRTVSDSTDELVAALDQPFEVG